MKKVSPNNIVLYISLAITIILSVVLTVVFGYNIFDLAVCITGVLYLALLADRNFINFLIGVINVTIYMVVSYKYKLYGEVIFYLCFDLPMSIVSYIFWRKHKDTKLTVKSRSMKVKNWIIVALLTAVFVFVYSMFLKLIGGENVYIDALSTIVSIVATILMAKQYREQWFMWVVVYVVSIIMWVFAFNPLMIIMSVECTIISALGWIEWHQNSKQKEASKQLLENEEQMLTK